MTVTAVLIGAGGFGRETLDVVEAYNSSQKLDTENKIKILGVVDDSPNEVNVTRLSRQGYSLLGSIDYLLSLSEPGNYILGIGAPAVKKRIADRLEGSGWSPVTVIHPSAVIGSVESIGSGTIICGGVQLSTNTKVGRHVHLNPNSTIGHDGVLEEFVSVNPGAIISGEVKIGKNTLIGAGAVILQNLDIGAHSLVGAGACVTHDVMAGSTVVGVPARPIEKNRKFK